MNDEALILSIIIPVFNRQKSFDRLMADLSNAIANNHLEKSLLKEKIEIIIIDDASTTPITLPKFPSKIRLERNKKNSGAPFSREKGLQLAQGKFIHFHDSDDSISINWLSELVKELITKPKIDILVTGRVDFEHQGKTHRYPTFVHKHLHQLDTIRTRLTYWNCIGPIGGVIFSRRILQTIKIKRMASCQDWQMYIDALETIKNTNKLSSRPDIQFLFHKTGNDRISHNARKKILGHLQLSRQTEKNSLFGRNIRLFYLYACKQHVFNQGGIILKFYKKNHLKIIAMFLLIATYSFLPHFEKSNSIKIYRR